MKIKRIDFKRIEIEIDGHKYTLTSRLGELKVHSHSDGIIVKPRCANEVIIKGQFN